MKHIFSPSRCHPLAGMVALVLCCGTFAAGAASRNWTGAGANAFWSTAANWSPAGVPADGDTLTFPAGATRAINTNDLSGRSFVFLIFTGTNHYALVGNGITLSGGVNSVQQGSVLSEIALDVTLANDLRVVADGARVLFDGSKVILAGHTLTLNTTTSNSEASVEGEITGVGDVIKIGPGETLFGGPDGNTYQGTTYISEGLLKVGKGNGGAPFGIPGPLVLGETNDMFVSTFGKVLMLRANMIDPTVPITFRDGQLDMNGFDQRVGPMLFLGASIKTGDGILFLQSNITQRAIFPVGYSSIDGNVFLNSDVTFNMPDFVELRLTARIAGPGGLTKEGIGNLVMYGSNTVCNFTGPLNVNDGMLELDQAPFALDGLPGVTLNDSGFLGLTDISYVNKSLTINSPFAGLIATYLECTWNGPIFLNFPGKSKFRAGDPFNFADLRIRGSIQGTGGISFSGRTVELFADNSFTGFVSSACEFLLLNTGGGRPFSGPLEAGGNYTYGKEFFEFHVATNPVCEVRWLDNAFQFVPQATIRTNGWANLNGHDNEFGSVDMTGGRISSGGGLLYLDGPVTTHPSVFTATIEGRVQLSTFPAVTFTVDDGMADPDLRISAVLSDGVPSGIDKEGDGELLLSAANTYRQATTVGRGLLHIQNDAALGTTGAGTTVLDGATLYNETAAALAEPLALSGAGRGGTNGALFLGPATGVQAGITLATNATIRNDASFAILSSVISGQGSLTKTGAGTLQLGGGSGAANTYTGDTLVNEGELVLDKPFAVTAVPGHLIIGAATVRESGSFQIIGSVTVNRGGLWDLSGNSESFAITDLQGHPPLTLNGGGDVQTGAGTLTLPPGGDVVMDPAGVPKASSFISGNIGLDPGPHHFIVGSTLSVLSNIVELDISAAISQTSSAADIVKEGSGDMRLGGSNSFTGTVTVNGGNLFVANGSALGTSAGGTTINNGAALALEGGVWVKNESLTLNTTNPVAITSIGAVTNTWSGNVILQQPAGIDVPASGGALYFDSIIGCCAGIVSGPGGLTKTGPGGMRFFGGPANTFTGPTIITGGLVEAARTQGPALSGNITVSGAGTTLRTGSPTATRDLPAAASVMVQDGASWAMNAGEIELLSRFVGNGNVDLGSASALTVSNDASCTFSGLLSGTGALNKRGPATFQVTANSYSYTGLATVVEGTYKVDGDILYAPATVKAGAILRGGGALGDVTVEAGGVVKVDRRYSGLAGGAFLMNSVNFQPSGGVLSLDFFGPSPTGGNDELYVNGAVSLGNLNLSAGFLYPPHEGDVVTLITKSAAGAVNGIISGFPEGSVQNIGDIPVVVSYVGGDGNDVTLTVTNLPLGGGGAQLASGNFGSTLVPNDCSQLSLVVTNRSTTTVSNLHGTLRSLTDGVVVTIAESAFPNLAPNARGTNATPFQIRTDSSFPCGAGAQFELVLTASNAPTTAIGYTLLGASGYALEFDGRDDQVEIARNTFSSVVNNFTIELWANPTANRTQTGETNAGISGVNAALRQIQRFAVFPDRANFAYGVTHVSAGLSIGRNGISAYEQGTNYLPSRLVYSNAVSGWTHVALVYTNRAPRLYVNGLLVRSGAASSFTSVHPSGSLGGSPQADYGNFDGQLDEVRIWNAALSQSQIQSNMSRSLTGSEANLVTYFRCDEGGGSLLHDSASASPNPTGTVTNGAAFVFPGVVPFTPAVGCDSGGGACESCLVVSGTFTTNTPTLAAPLDPSYSPSVCFPVKACPGAFPIPPLTPFIQHTFTNTTGTQACVTAQLHFDCLAAPNQALHAAAYLGAFDTNDPCLNYLGDSGGYGTAAFSFPVPAGSNFVIIVTLWVGDIGCNNYTLELFGLPCPPPALAIANDTAPGKVQIRWSSAYPDYRLQTINSIDGPGPYPFGPFPTTPVLVSGKYSVTNDTTASPLFFRLAK